MIVRKILEATLVAGSTSVTFTDTDIPNSLLRVYSTKSALFPISQTLSGNSVTVNYKPQDSNVGVALEIVKSGLDIVDDLESEDATKALSANQGYVLKGLIDGIVIPTVPENINDLADVSITTPSDGQVLTYNNGEWINEYSSAGSTDYSETEQRTGKKWINGDDVFMKVINIGAFPNATTKSVPHNISSLNKVLSLKCIASRSNGQFIMIPLVSTGGGVNQISIGGDATNISITTGVDRSDFSGYVIMEYTKTS